MRALTEKEKVLKDSMKRLTANILREIENPYCKVLIENLLS